MSLILGWSTANESLAAPSRARAGHPRPPVPAPAIVAAAIDDPSAERLDFDPAAMPNVSDPLLEPLEAAPRTMTRWRDLQSALESRATDLRLALADVRTAEGQWRSALAGALPTLAGQAVAAHQVFTNAVDLGAGPLQVPTRDTLSGSLVLSQPLFAFAAWQAIGTASVDEEIARLGVVDAKRRVTQSAIAAAFAVVAAERVAMLNRSGLRAALERSALADRRAHYGAATSLDVARARLDADGVRTTLVNGDEALRRAREALGLVLGLAEPVGVESDALRGIVHDLEAACPAMAPAEERTDVLVERRRLAAAQRRVSNVDAQRLPTLTARAEGSYTTDTASSLGPPGLVTVEGVLSVPLWDGGALSGARRVAEANVDAARERIAARAHSAEIEIAQADRAIAIATSRLAIATTTRDDALGAERLQRIAFAQGRGTSLELVTSGATLRDAETSLVLRDLELLSARIAARLARARCRF